MTTVVQFAASTEVDGLSASEVDSGVLDAFKSVTADTLGLTSDDINITSVTDVNNTATTRQRRLGGGVGVVGRSLAGSKRAKISFVVIIVMEKTAFTNKTVAVQTYDALLDQKFTNSSTGSQLVSLAIQLGSTVPAGTVVTFTAPTVDYSYTVIIVKTGAPTSVPAERATDDDSSSGQDMTPIIIGVAVGGGALIIILLASFYYFSGGKSSRKIEPR